MGIEISNKVLLMRSNVIDIPPPLGLINQGEGFIPPPPGLITQGEGFIPQPPGPITQGEGNIPQPDELITARNNLKPSKGLKEDKTKPIELKTQVDYTKLT